MPSYNLDPEHLMKDVYSYPFPEVRELLNRPPMNPGLTLNTLDGDDAADMLRPYEFEPPLELSLRDDHTLDLDEIHVPIIDRIRRTVREALPGIEGFDYAYPTPGSSQAMFSLMAEWHAQGSMESLAVIEGEYEGYAAYAKSLRIPVKQHASLGDAQLTPGEVWFVSNPSAVNGNWHKPDEFKKFIAGGHQTVLDAAYVGLTVDGAVDVSAPNIRAVLTSPSKIFGVFRYRNAGVTYSREQIDCMYGTKWFKDVPALLDTLSLYEKFGGNQLAHRYRPVQEFLCGELSKVVDSPVEPSDVLLLGHAIPGNDERFRSFARAGGRRFGLTKLFEDYEAWQKETSEEV